MKMSASNMIMIGVIAAVLSLIAVMAKREFSPAPMRFEGVRVAGPMVGSDLLRVVAVTPRRETRCLNGVQVDIRDQTGTVTRLPVPTRKMQGSQSEYLIVIPDTTLPGQYSLQVRETFVCGGGSEDVEADWISVTVAPSGQRPPAG